MTSEDVGRASVARRLLLGWLATATAAVVVVTLFPYDFRMDTDRRGVFGFDADLSSSYVLADVPANVVLFVPFGFATAGLIRLSGRWSAPVAFVAAAASGAVVSLVMEAVQGALLTRFASVGDVIANSAGALIGAVLGWSLAAPAARRIAPRAGDRPRLLVRVSTATLLAACGLAAVARFDDAAAPAGWSSDARLVLGNETSGDRPWRGSVASFSFESVSSAGRTTLASWDFTSGRDGFPPLSPAGVGSPVVGPNGTLLDSTAWWQSSDPVTSLSSRVVASGSFIVELDVTPASVDQRGPARIVTISNGVDRRNVTVGQSGDALVLRIRSELLGPDGSDPQLTVPHVFEAGRPRQLTIRSIDGVIDVEVDGRRSSCCRLDLGGEVATMMSMFPNTIEDMRTGALGEWWIRITYRAVVLAPCGLAVAAIVARRNGPGSPLALTLASAVVVAVMFEVLLAVLTDRGLRPAGVVTGSVVIATVALVFRCPPTADGQDVSGRDG